MERNILSYDAFFIYCVNTLQVYRGVGGYYFKEEELNKLIIDTESIVYIPCIDFNFNNTKVWIEK